MSITSHFAWLTCVGVITAMLTAPPAARGQQSGSSTADVLTLKQAVALALQHNRLVENAQLEAEKYEDKLAAARTRRLPSFSLYTLGTQLVSPIDFEFPRGVFGTFPGIGPIPAENTALTTPRRPTALIVGQVSQPLTQQYRIGLSLEQLKVGREIAREELRSQQQSSVNQVKQAYYGILQTQSGLQSAEEATRLYRELERVTGEHVLQQVALKSESLEVKTRLARSEYETSALSDRLASQKEQLNHLLGRDIRTDFSVSPVPEAVAYETDLEAAHSRALGQRPEVKEARLKVKQAEFDVRAKRAEYIPDVSLTFHYISLLNFDQFVPRNIASVGIMLNWEVFDWGRKKREVAEKIRTARQADNGVLEAESAVLLEVNGKFRRLQETRQLLQISQLAQETARETVRITTNRYGQQTTLLQSVLQAQTSLAEANYQYEQALLAFWNARAELDKAMGEDQ